MSTRCVHIENHRENYLGGYKENVDTIAAYADGYCHCGNETYNASYETTKKRLSRQEGCEIYGMVVDREG